MLIRTGMPPTIYGTQWSPTDHQINVSFDSTGRVVTLTDATTGNQRAGRAIAGKSSSKYYFEVELTTNNGGFPGCGVGSLAQTLASIANATSSCCQSLSDGNIYSNGNHGAIASAFVAGDRWCWAVDADNFRVWVRKNGGAWMGSNVNYPSADPAAGTGYQALGAPASVVPCFDMWSNNGTQVLTLMATYDKLLFAAPAGFFPGWPP